MAAGEMHQDWRLELVEYEGPQGWQGILGALSARGSLRELRGNGDEIVVNDPEGREHRLSLAPWATADPDATFLAVRPIALRDTAVPESLSVCVEDLPSCAPGANERALRQLESISVTLADLRAAFGGEDGVIVDRYGREHAVSLRGWRSADDDIHLVVSFRFRQAAEPRGDGRMYVTDPLAFARPAASEA